MARFGRLLCATALFVSACAQPATYPLTVERAAYDAVAGLEAGAGPHAKSMAVSRWMQRHLMRSAFEAPAEPSRVLAAGRMDAVGAAALFRAMLDSLGLRSRVLLATRADGAAWYPLVEVLDADGDHAWDPLYGRYVPDYDGSPLPVRRWPGAEDIRSTADDLTAPSIQSPTLDSLARATSGVLRPSQTLITHVDVERDTNFGFLDASDADLRETADVAGHYGPALAAVGQLATPLGDGSFAIRFSFSQAATGSTVRMRYSFVKGSPRDLVIIGTGAALAARDDAGRTLEFALQATQATVTVGAKAGRAVWFDSFEWSGL